MNELYEHESDVLEQELGERLQRKVRMRTLRIWLIGIAIVLAVLTALAFLLMKIFFSVKEVTIETDGTYTAEEILEASGIEKGDLLLFINKNKATAGILDKYVMIESVGIERRLPDGVMITVTNEVPYFFFEHESISGDGTHNYAVVAKSQKILEVLTSREEMYEKYGALPCVRMPELLYASQGKKIEYSDPGDSDYIPELLALLKNSVFNNEILIVDARVRFDIVIYSGVADDGLPKYELKIGNKKRIEDKIALAQSIAKDKLDENFKGEISVGADGDDNVKSAYARART